VAQGEGPEFKPQYYMKKKKKKTRGAQLLEIKIKNEKILFSIRNK
jgi:hypothetical protein